MTNDELDRLAALGKHIVLRTGDDEMAVVPALVAEVRRLRALVREAYIEADMGWRMEGTDTIDAEACFLESAACKALDGAA